MAPAAPRRTRLARLAALLAVVWSAGLALLAWLTANPEFVSPYQIQAADVVVEAEVASGTADRLAVKRVFKGQAAAGDELKVLNLHEVPGLRPGATYLVPLSRFRDDFVVTVLNQHAAEGRAGHLLVYAASPHTRRQVQAALR